MHDDGKASVTRISSVTVQAPLPLECVKLRRNKSNEPHLSISPLPVENCKCAKA